MKGLYYEHFNWDMKQIYSGDFNISIRHELLTSVLLLGLDSTRNMNMILLLLSDRHIVEISYGCLTTLCQLKVLFSAVVMQKTLERFH